MRVNVLLIQLWMMRNANILSIILKGNHGLLIYHTEELGFKIKIKEMELGKVYS